MLKRIILFFVLISISALSAQTNLFYQDYQWNDEVISEFNKEEHQDKEIVVLKKKRVSEFAFTVTKNFVEYLLVHNIYWLNSNDKIEEFNKVYLPISNSNQLIKNKARVITANGKIIELDDSKILESKDNNTKVSYKYYALEGIEKGSFVEYYYVIKKYPDYTGASIKIQSEYYTELAEFDLYAPDNLVFTSKSYNGLLQMEKDTLSKAKNHWQLKAKDILPLEREENSAYQSELQQLVYKLDRNLLNSTKEIISYGNISQEIFANLNPEIDKKTSKKIKNYIKNIGLEGLNEEQSIRKIEHYIKTNIFYNEVQSDASSIEFIIQNKIANSSGLLVFYAALFNELDVDYEVVLTSNRKQLLFDKEYESYNFLESYLIYFPKLDLYLEPKNYESRLGFPNSYLTDTYGLFIKKIKLGEFVSGVGKVRYINPVNYDKSAYNLLMNVNFDSDNITNLDIKMEREMSGYYSVNFQPFMDLVKPEQKSEMAESIVKGISENVTILETSFENEKAESFGVKPMKVIAKLESENFVENAGNKYLFKVGELIGPQAEIYQEKNRKLPVCGDFERMFKNRLVIQIPEGYVFKNLEELNIDESYSENGEVYFTFKSSYSVVDDVLTIDIDEFYNKNNVPLELYEDYRRVINSAANFNKITLILDK